MNDPLTLPDTIDDTLPDTDVHNELVDAIEWLKRAGVVSGERPAFAGFFDEIVNSAEDDG
jgi:hypothetical protein